MIEVKLYCLSMMQAVITVARYLVCVCVFLFFPFFLFFWLWVCGWQRERKKERKMSWRRIITSCILISLAGLMDTCNHCCCCNNCIVSKMPKQRAFPALFPYHKGAKPLCNVTCKWPQRSSKHIQSPPRGLKGQNPIQCLFGKSLLTRRHTRHADLLKHVQSYKFNLGWKFCLNNFRDRNAVG